MSGIGEHPIDQFRFFLRARSEGHRCALVTIVGIIATASRNIGTHIIVRDDGVYAGSVSSGCVDGNVAAVALTALEAGTVKRLQLGAGSPFVDIKLPCGGGLDLLIHPDPPDAIIKDAIDNLARRNPVALTLTEHSIACSHDADDRTDDTATTIQHVPKMRLVLAGRGSELVSFCRTALAADFDVMAISPDEVDIVQCQTIGAATEHIQKPDAFAALNGDPWTAIVLLFHDHDWEPFLLKAALNTDAFYIGALGSRKTQDNRLAMLAERGIGQDALSRLRGPIGLVPSMRNASMLAISTLAEIIAVYHEHHT